MSVSSPYVVIPALLESAAENLGLGAGAPVGWRVEPLPVITAPGKPSWLALHSAWRVRQPLVRSLPGRPPGNESSPTGESRGRGKGRQALCHYTARAGGIAPV